MATSPIYGWLEPDNTDLVKNGALAIRTLGNAIDTTMGTMVAKTVVDAKGDLIVGTAADTVGRLAVAENGSTLVADSSTSTGLRYQGTMAAGKNLVINGNFDIWQRGTSIANAGNTYTADRWVINSGEAQTISRQTSGAFAGSQYYMRSTATQAACFMVPTQFIETSQAAALWGKTVTVTVLVRRNATMTTDLTLGVAKTTTTDGGTGATWTDIGTTTITNASMPTATTSTDWYKATLTVAIPNDGTANTLRVRLLSGSLANGSTMDMSQFQLELGSVATAFSRAGGTIQGELSACSRYYTRTVSSSGNQTFGMGLAISTTAADINVNLPVTMRTVPSSMDANALRLDDGVSAITSGTYALSTTLSSPNVAKVQLTGASGLTQYRPYFISSTTSAGVSYLGFSAEL